MIDDVNAELQKINEKLGRHPYKSYNRNCIFYKIASVHDLQQIKPSYIRVPLEGYRLANIAFECVSCHVVFSLVKSGPVDEFLFVRVDKDKNKVDENELVGWL